MNQSRDGKGGASLRLVVMMPSMVSKVIGESESAKIQATSLSS